MEQYIKTTDAFDEQKRCDAVNRLRNELSLPDMQPLPINKSPLSIGIEIEMTWRHAFPELANVWPRPGELDKTSLEFRQFSEAYDSGDKRLKPRLEHIRRLIPRVGLDAYWEFSFLPSRDINVTISELSILYETGILTDQHDYSMHMTVAGINNDRDAFAFICGIEQTGGTNANRISEAVTSKKGAWARKGFGGIMKRHTSELIGDDEDGYEFRTLAATSREQVVQTLGNAALLSRLLHDDYESWKDYRKQMEDKLLSCGFELAPWPQPKNDPALWQRYTQLLQ